jgi:DNA polymerase-3 subunit delta
MDLAALERDMEKMIAFVGERPEIQCQDLEAICTDQRIVSLWQLLDCILFAKRKLVFDTEIDTPYLLTLLSQMRIQLQRGLEMRVLLEKKLPSADIFKQFSMLKKNQCEKLYSFAQKQDKRWIVQALHHLFQIEMLAKNSSATPAVLLHMLSARLSNF